MPALKITFLGTGTSQGVPMIGCSCRVCTSTDPRDKRTRSSIYVEGPGCSWVVDTGPDFRAQCLREKINVLDAVVYTHSHTDHIMGFDDLRPFCRARRPMPIYGSAETLNDLERAFAFAFNGQNAFPGYILSEPHPISGPFVLGETTLTPLPVRHGRAAVNGYLLRHPGAPSLTYLSDCKEIPAAVLEEISDTDVLIIDALRHAAHPTHLNIEEALAVVDKVRPGSTWFTHLCHELRHEETERGLPPGVRIAYDGLKIEL